MTKAELTALTVVELKALAKKKKVPLSAGEKKPGIINALLSVMMTVKSATKGAASPAKNTVGKVTASAKVVKKKALIIKPAAKKTAKPVKAGTTKKMVANALAPASKRGRGAAVPVNVDAKKSAGAAKPAHRKSVKAVQGAVIGGTVAKKRTPAAPSRRTTPVREWKMPPGAVDQLMAQERVEESKYYTGPALQPITASAGDLPRGYNEDKISILSRDPFVAFAYWEASPARIEREKAWFGWDSKLAVRIYDITGVQFDGRNAIGFFDQEIAERVGSWYFDFGRPTHSFCADLGLISPAGKFLTITRSNYITMPRDGVSDVIDEEWMLVDEEFWKLYGYPEGFRRGVSSPEMQEMLKRRREMEISSPGLVSRDRPKRK